MSCRVAWRYERRARPRLPAGVILTFNPSLPVSLSHAEWPFFVCFITVHLPKILAVCLMFVGRRVAELEMYLLLARVCFLLLLLFLVSFSRLSTEG
jgi:hypothetical protein